MKDKIAIILPTWNNFQYLSSCVRSIVSLDFVAGLFHIYIINNGHKDSCNQFMGHPKITVIQAGKNLGWEGGLKLGLEKSEEPYVLFLNDDTYIPQSSSMWLSKMLNSFHRDKIGAVGPGTNVVMGSQNIFAFDTHPIKYVNYLIGYCVMVERKAFMEIGGVDDSLPGGDDIDFSIRFRNRGYRLVCDKSIFVYHHGFKTGERVHGTADKPLGWNSYEFKEKTDFALIKKHGFRKWYETLYTVCPDKDDFIADTEGEVIRGMDLKGKIVELGCGANKTIPEAIGVDMIPKGMGIDSLSGAVSQADIVADVSKELPIEKESVDVIIGRHILEHMFDPIEVLSYWMEILKKGGKMIIAVPDESKINSIPMNFEHKHAYTADSLSRLLKMVGMEVKRVVDPDNGISFIIEAVKL